MQSPDTVASRTLLDVVRLSTAYLSAHGSPSARLDAELLAAHTLRMRRLDVYLQFDRLLSPLELDAVREAVRRRAAGEPVAYITGRREFYGRSFEVTPDVLIPRPETETLVEVALRHLPATASATKPMVADLGTGSGCIAVTLACERSDITVTATDISAAALDVARRNASAHGVRDRIEFVDCAWMDGIVVPVDVVVSNPPYVTTAEITAAEPDVRDFEPRGALSGGDDGFNAYRELLASIRRRQGSVPAIILEVDPRRGDGVRRLMLEAFPDATVSVQQDLAGRGRVLAAVTGSAR